MGQDQPLNGVLSVPAKDAPGFGPVHFIVVTLRDARSTLLDRTLCWRSRTGPKYGADGPWTPLNGMPMVRLRVTSSVRKISTRQTVAVTLTNPTPCLAFFTRLKVYRARSQTLVQPTEYSDDYFPLLPQEKKTVTLNYDTASFTEPTGNVSSNAVDGDSGTRWASQLGHDPEWLMVDLGTTQTIQEVRLNWESACDRDYEIQVSDDAQH